MTTNTIIMRAKSLHVKTLERLTVTTLTSIITTIQSNPPVKKPRDLMDTTLTVTITTTPLNRYMKRRMRQ